MMCEQTCNCQLAITRHFQKQLGAHNKKNKNSFGQCYLTIDNMGIQLFFSFILPVLVLSLEKSQFVFSTPIMILQMDYSTFSP